MAAAGIRDILITSTLSQPSKMRRAADLAKSGAAVTMVADDPGLVDQLQALTAEAGARLDVLVDLGRRRNGVATIEQARAVAARIASSSALTMKGVQAYASHISHIETFAERDAAARQSAATIAAIRSALEADGHVISCVSGGSTGTLLIDSALHCYTELQCGSYVFNDVEYRSIDLDGRRSEVFAPAIFVRVFVICRNVKGRVTCDGGNKHFSAKGTSPAFLIRRSRAPSTVPTATSTASSSCRKAPPNLPLEAAGSSSFPTAIPLSTCTIICTSSQATP